MAPVELHPLSPTVPTAPVHRVEADERRHDSPRRRALPARPQAESDTVDADGHIDTHV